MATVEEVEPRILYAADLNPALWAADSSASPSLVAPLQLQAQTTAAAEVNSAVDSPTALRRKELVFIDASVADAERLIHAWISQPAAQTDREWIAIEAGRDGLQQISEVLAHSQKIDALHIISHGAQGQLQLGTTTLDSAALAQRSEEIIGWQHALSADADLLLWGCDVGAGPSGLALVQQLAVLSGADVAASVDLTGPAQRSGNWVLEVQTGGIEAALPDGDAFQQWDHTLGIGANAGGVSSAGHSNTNSLAWSHTVASGSNRVLFVELAINAAGVSAGSVTYGGVALTQVGRSTGNHAVEIWHLVAPAVGTANVEVSLSGTTSIAAGASTFDGVDPSSPVRTYTGASGSSTNPTVNVPSATGDLVLEVTNFNVDSTGYAVGSGQTATWAVPTGNNSGRASTEAGAATVTMSSTTTESRQWTIGAVSIRPASNFAPVLADTALSLTVTEDAGAPVGAVGSLVSGFTSGISDANGGAQGIAITAADTSHGTWYYSTDGGSNWALVGTVSTASALQLADDGNTRLYFAPTAQYSGTQAAGLTVVAWDQSTGSNGTKAAIPSGPQSVADTFATNDYIRNDGSSNWSHEWLESDSSGGGASGGEILVTSGYLRFIPNVVGDKIFRLADLSGATAVTFSVDLTVNMLNTGGQIDMQVSGDGGSSYTTLAAIVPGTSTGTLAYDISAYAAIGTKVRFLAQGASTSGIRLDNVQVLYSRQGGGGTAFSSTSDTVALNVTAVSDPPVNTVPGAQATAEDTSRVFSSGNGNAISITDLDAGGANNQITLSVSNGSLTLAGITGLSFVTGDGTADATMTLSGTAANINTALNGLSYSPGANYNGAATLTLATKDATLLSLDLDTGMPLRFEFAGNANDSGAGSTQNGTLTDNAAIVVDGTRGQVLALDGAGDHVDLAAHVGSVSGMTEGTISGWIKSTGTLDTIFSVSDTADTGSYAALFLGASGYLTYEVYENGVAQVAVYRSSGALTDGNWHHVAVTVDSSGNRLYVDGELATSAQLTYDSGTASTQRFFSSVSSLDAMSIGRTADSAGGKWHTDGLLDEMRLFDRALTATEINALASDLSLLDTDTVAITVSAVNDIPVITLSGYSGTYVENAAALYDPGATLSDVDNTNFNGGNLTYQIVANGAASDELGIRNEGTGAGQIGLSGNNVSYGGVVFGSHTGFGYGSSALVVSFNSNATTAAVQALLRNVSYRDTSEAPSTATRTLHLSVNDGSGGTSSPAIVTIAVTSVNDAPNFLGGTGMVTTDVLSNAMDFINAAVVQPDGKTLVTGYSSINNNDIVLARYHEDGTLDGSFGGGDGLVTLDAAGSSDLGRALALLGDGRILVAGNIGNDIGLAQFNADGTLDTGFGGGDGMATAGIAGATGYGLQVQADGKILVGGRLGADMLVVRLQNNGTVDTGFGSSGSTTVNFNGSNDIAYSLVLQSDGRILLGGTAYTGASFDAAVARLTSSGTLDTSFNGTGRVTTDIGSNSSDTAYAMALQSDGKIVLSGWSDGSGNNDYFTVRYNSDGTLDTDFSGDGKVTTALSTGSDLPADVLVQSDGKIIVAGTSGNASNNFGVVRYNADGTLDTGFNGTGIVDMAFGTSTDDRANAIALHLDGRITIAGTSTLGGNYQLALARYTSAGALDTRLNLANTLDAAPAFTEGGSAVVLDSNVQLFDLELNSTNYSGATLTLQRNGGANAQDVYSATGTLASLTQGGNLVVDSVNIGTVTTHTGGTLVLSFNASATTTLVSSAARKIAYSNSSDAPPATVQINWTVSDGNTGAQGSGGMLSASGSTTVGITATNDAPTITNGTALSLSDTDEDTVSFAVVVTTLLASSGYADPDAGAMQGLAVTGVTGSGSWQYSTDGSTWTPVGTVNATQALLLSASSSLRYLPGGSNAESAGFSFRAWDTTTGLASAFGAPSTANPGVGGGTSANSAGSASASRNVTAVNDAPVLADAALSLTVGEDAGTPTGAVGSLVSAFTGGISDVDTGAAKGIAITGSIESNGTWYYTINGGSNWVAVGAVNSTSALLLADDASTRLYFQAHSDYAGTTSGALTLRAWDQTTGSAGSKVSTASHGGTTAFSSASDSVDLTVSAVNDAPTNGLPGPQATAMNSTLVLSGAKAISVADVDATTLQVTLGITHGSLTLAGTAGLSFSSGDGMADATLVFSGSAAAINAALDGMSYAPAAGYQGAAALSVTTSDLGGTGSGGTLTDADTLDIQVGAKIFQQGTSGYGGAVDTYVASDSPTTDRSGANPLMLVGDSAGDAILLRFDSLFGNGAGQVPAGSTITSASLSFYVTNTDANDAYSLHQMLGSWAATSTFNSLTSGVQANGTEAAVSALATLSAGNSGWQTINGLAAVVQAWTYGGTNNGFTFLTSSADNWAFASAEHASVALRPYLSINYVAPQPALVAISGGQASYTENGTAVAVDPGLVLSDADSTQLTGATVTITAGYSASQDSLLFTNQAGVTGSWDSGSGVLTLSGTATVAQYQAALRSITYSNSSEAPSTMPRTVSFTVQDAWVSSASVSTDVAVTAVNDAPVLADAPLALTMAEDAGVPSGAVGALLSAYTAGISDPDSAAVTGIAITATLQTHGTWYYSTNGGSHWAAVGSVSADAALLLADNPSTRLYFAPAINFNGTAASALSLRAWDQSSGSAGSVVNASSHGGNTAFSTAIDVIDVEVTPSNDAPVLTSAALTLSEGQTVTLAPGDFSISDPDNTSFTYTASSISGGHLQLSSAAGNPITTFTSAQLAASQVQFVDDGDEAAPAFSVQVHDGDVDSNVLAATVSYTPVNEAPVVTAASWAVNEGQTVTLTTANISTTDPDDTSFTYTVSGVSGGYLQLSSAAGTSITSFTTAQLAGSLVQFVDDGDEVAPAFSIQVNDGDVDSNVLAAGTNYTPVNDEPGVTAAWLSLNEGETVSLAAGHFGITDPDDNSFNYAVSGVSGGYFQLRTAAGTPITTFTSAALAGGLVQFVDDGNEVAPDFSVKVNDGDEDSNVLAAVVNYTPVNDAPVVTAATLTLNEGETLTLTVGSFNIIDPDDTAFVYTVSGVSGAYFQLNSAAGTPVTTFTSAHLAAGQVQFVDDGNDAAPAFSVMVNDGEVDSPVLATTIHYRPVNDAPVLTGASLTLNEGGTVTLASGNFSVADPDNTSFLYTVSGLSGGYFQRRSATGTPITTFTSDDLAAGQVQFVDDGDEVQPAFSVKAADNMAETSVRAADVVFLPVDDAPTLAQASTLVYTENQGAAAINPHIVVGDSDHTTLVSAAVHIAGNYQPGEDELFFTNSAGMGPIVGTWDPVTGRLHLHSSGAAATMSQWQAALRTVAYLNDSEHPSPDTRTLSVTINDGQLDSNSLITTVQVNRVNDAPTVLNLDAREVFIEDTALNLTDIVVLDPDSGEISVALTLSNPAAGLLESTPAGTASASFDAATGVWSARGTLVDVNASLAQLRFLPAPNFAGSFIAAVAVNDGVSAPVVGSKRMEGRPVDDAPIGELMLMGTPAQGQTLVADYRNLSDPDGLGRLNYQWLRSGAPIPTAVAASYTVTADDIGSQLAVVVSWTDEQGFEEAHISAATERIARGFEAELSQPSEPSSPPNEASSPASPNSTGAGEGAEHEEDDAADTTELELVTIPVMAPLEFSAGLSIAGVETDIHNDLHRGSAFGGTFVIQNQQQGMRSDEGQAVQLMSISFEWVALDATVGSQESAEAAAREGLRVQTRGSGAAAADTAEADGRASTSEGDETQDTGFMSVLTSAAPAAGMSVTASALWWLTRSGGLLTSMLMGVPAWRHVDLLPVLSNSAAARPRGPSGVDDGDSHPDATADFDDSAVADLFMESSFQAQEEGAR